MAAMELVARDMKALGHYIARNLSYDGVDYDRVEHVLSPDQRAIYDKLADGLAAGAAELRGRAEEDRHHRENGERQGSNKERSAEGAILSPSGAAISGSSTRSSPPCRCRP
jgi:hypothetical protein